MARNRKDKNITIDIKLKGLEKQITVTKVTAINLTSDDQSFMHLDKLADGTWRLLYDAKLIPDTTKLEGLEIVRPKN